MKKKNYIYLTGGILIVLLIILAIYVAYYCISRDPKTIIKRSINTVMTSLESNLKEEENNSLLDSNTYEFSSTLNLDISDTDINKEKIKLKGLVDFSNKDLELSATFSEDNTDVLDITYLLHNTNKYIKSNTLFSNVYNIDNYTCENEILCKILNYDYFSIKDDTNIILSDIVKDIKNNLINDVNDNNTELITDKDNALDIYKYTLTKESFESIYDNLNSDSKDIISEILKYIYEDSSKEEILNDLDNIYIEICFKEGTKDFEKLNIYDEDKDISYTIDNNGEGNLTIPELDLVCNFTKDSFSITILNEYYIKGIINNEDDKLDINYTMGVGSITIKGNLTNKINVNDGYLNGNLDLTIGGSAFVIYKFNAGINIDYNLSKDISSKFTDIDNNLDINEWTNEDETKYNEAFDNFCNTYVGGLICGKADDERLLKKFTKIIVNKYSSLLFWYNRYR